MPFSRGKRGFFCVLKEQRKENNNKTKNKKQKRQTIIKKGFRAKWGLPSGHLTWPLNPKNKKLKNKKQKTKKITNKEGLGPSEVALQATSPDP